jgi:hypothetical protein
MSADDNRQLDTEAQEIAVRIFFALAVLIAAVLVWLAWGAA